MCFLCGVQADTLTARCLLSPFQFLVFVPGHGFSEAINEPPHQKTLPSLLNKVQWFRNDFFFVFFVLDLTVAPCKIVQSNSISQETD